MKNTYSYFKNIDYEPLVDVQLVHKIIAMNKQIDILISKNQVLHILCLV